LQRLDALRTRQEVDWPGVLTAVRQAVPEGVCVTELACRDGRNLSVQGLAPSCDAVQQFVRDLNQRGLFVAVFLARLQRQPDQGNGLEYQIDCLVKPAP